ncbi:hypothetical protein MICAB_5600019 [Microcystis aeruginosa PCC 9717]|uniref:Uncharacterized protein n=1 Tax=Microcystis aeruginosa PCC 9717 TaxID=1160286 RepID=I4FTL5_MICAE|nr:hypothetical protein [Microcystis sp. LE19-41.2A]MCZ8289674.1 hypothetical protein [Microcystis sp. LE19-59.1C]CCH98990.1 hypothetical protein MICAB_5600019 [Microcystis aeruginosa PCC 9717]
MLWIILPPVGLWKKYADSTLNLKSTEAHAAMGYYFDHQEEIDQQITQERDQTQVKLNGFYFGSPI